MSQYHKLHNTVGCQYIDQCKVCKKQWVLVKVLGGQVLQGLGEPSEKTQWNKLFLGTLTPASELECE